MKLTNIVEIKAKLVLQTGLHIGAGDSEMHIGGIDNSVIKHPMTQSPYIPGSSLKGKIRTLLEWRSGAVQSAPLSLKDISKNPEEVKNILRLFGISGDTKNSEQEVAEIGVSRLAFWDCALNEAWENEIRDDNQLLTEAKSENTKKRMEIMTTSTDGFYISEEDLKLRGSGEMFGRRQSGDEEFILANIYDDLNILKGFEEKVDLTDKKSINDLIEDINKKVNS